MEALSRGRHRIWRGATVHIRAGIVGVAPEVHRSPAAHCTHMGNNNYDFLGAFGLMLAPRRDWAGEESWFCYEFGAGWLRTAGRDVFANLSHVGEIALMSINP